MNVVAERFVELAVTMHYRPLTDVERKEFIESYQWLLNRQWRVAKLKNLSLVAYMSGDADWHYEICRELERLEGK